MDNLNSDSFPSKRHTLIVLLCLATSIPAAAESPSDNLQGLIDRYCITCHNETLNTANLNLDNFRIGEAAQDGHIWEKVIHKLRTNEMPPMDRSQPSKGARNALIIHLTTTLDEAAENLPDPGRPAIHRLNRTEYSNVIRDLLGLEIDPKDYLPADDADYGFDNIADSLKISPMLIERYMMAASKISRQAVGDMDLRPSYTIYSQSKTIQQFERMSDDFSFGSRGGITARHHFPLDAEYIIEVDYQSPKSENTREHHQRSEALEQLDIRIDGKQVDEFHIKLPDSSQWSYEEGGFVDGAPKKKEDVGNHWDVRTVETRLTAKAGTQRVTATFLNRTLAYEGVRPRYYPAFYTFGSLKNSEPGILEMRINGPFNPTGLGEESQSRNKIFTQYPTKPEEELDAAKQILSNLARKAYRRPVTERDLDTLLDFYTQGRNAGDFEDGIRLALERLLVSPDFLFRVETPPIDLTPGELFALSDTQLASRISFFLWSTIPDEELLVIAEQGQLRAPGVLEGQIQRMLKDSRANSLVENFAAQWLHLRNLESITPDVNIFPEFDGNLRNSMRSETELFIASQIREDHSIADLISADYTYLNQRLAEHYDIPGIYGSQFRRVEATDENRGGLLGQSSIWTVTSYATRTSPVKRGKWILDNLLGSPPPPPPSDIPPLPEPSEATEGLTTRQLFEQHRKDPMCASCHIKMDPLGFALENFDAVGRWRTHDAAGLELDTSGTMPDGTHLQGPAGLKNVLLKNQDEFTRTVVQKLLTYALGRGIEHHDQPAIRKVIRNTAVDDHTWSSVITEIIKSTPFQMRQSG